jgi:hypothetical protein
MATYAAVRRRNKKAFGFTVNLHRFRHAAASFWSIDGLEAAWGRIYAEIEGQPMPQPQKDEFRKGLLLACKLIAQNA